LNRAALIGFLNPLELLRCKRRVEKGEVHLDVICLLLLVVVCVCHFFIVVVVVICIGVGVGVSVGVGACCFWRCLARNINFDLLLPLRCLCYHKEWERDCGLSNVQQGKKEPQTPCHDYKHAGTYGVRTIFLSGSLKSLLAPLSLF